ncbi:MAG: YHS domain-containing protein [Sideroxydans sp.]|jgi:YHS domain-containing protein|nr:YHS domain-containing protein [Sideroxydans sp.]
MAWLEQNWISILLVIGVIFMMRRMGCGSGANRHHHSDNNGGVAQPQSESNIDPVSGNAVDPQIALTSVYQGRTYYFASRENRDRFEASPEQFAVKSKDKPGHGCC